MAQHRTFAATQHGGHPSALRAQRSMTKGVDLRRHTDQAACGGAIPHGFAPDAEAEQLFAGDHTVLRLGQAKDLPTRGDSTFHMNV
jgi:hypothetical protein